MFTDQDIITAQCRRQDLMRAADRERLISLARPANRSPHSAYQRWLAQLGAWLVERGEKLQGRYAQPSIRPWAASE